MTKEALLKAKKDLEAILSNHAMNDYIQANYNKGKRKSKKHIPYSLASETEEARQMYHIVYREEPWYITREQEEEIKAYLLPYRTHRTEYLIHTKDKSTNYVLER